MSLVVKVSEKLFRKVPPARENWSSGPKPGPRLALAAPGVAFVKYPGKVGSSLSRP